MKPQKNLKQASRKESEDYLIVFIVDKESRDRHIAEQQFKTDDGFKVYSFRSGEDCFHYYNYLKPDLVILDYDLNRINPLAMSGLELLKKLKKTDSSLPVMVVSDYDRMEEGSKAFKNGAFDFILKSDNDFLYLKELSLKALHPAFEKKKAIIQKRQRRTLRVSLIIAFYFFLILFNFVHILLWTTGLVFFLLVLTSIFLIARKNPARQTAIASPRLSLHH